MRTSLRVKLLSDIVPFALAGILHTRFVRLIMELGRFLEHPDGETPSHPGGEVSRHPGGMQEGSRGLSDSDTPGTGPQRINPEGVAEIVETNIGVVLRPLQGRSVDDSYRGYRWGSTPGYLLRTLRVPDGELVELQRRPNSPGAYSGGRACVRRTRDLFKLSCSGGSLKACVALSSVLFLLSALPTLADDTIPTPLKASRYEDLWLNSPFLRSLNAAESYVITSVTSIDGKPFVTVCNTTTGERFMLSNVKNSQGWRLIDLRTDSDPRNVIARVSIADEEMTVRFGEDQISAKALLTAAQGAAAAPTPPNNAAFRQNETLRLQTALRERLLQGERSGKGQNNLNKPGDASSNKSGSRRTQQGKQ